MRSWKALLVGAMALAASLAACLDGSDGPDPPAEGYPRYEEGDGRVHFEFPAGENLVHVEWAPGGGGRVWNKQGPAVEVALPSNLLLVLEDGDSLRLRLAGAPFTLDEATEQEFLAPPVAKALNVTVAGEAFALDSAAVPGAGEAWDRSVSGRNAVDLMHVQEDRFAHRTPGQENYTGSIGYFAGYFRGLGYDVEVDPFGTQAATNATGACRFNPLFGSEVCPESLANVVAIKPGVEEPGKVIFVAGGHFDVVPGTTHGAFDNTGGTVATLELARALAPYDFRYTLMFGLWGGEENGLLGSAFWVQSHPEMRARILTHVNLDVVGQSWPVPLPNPDTLLITAGPDVGTGGPTQDPASRSLLDWMRTLQEDWFGYPTTDGPEDREVFRYIGWASEQNWPSDHTSFIAAGIPSYFIASSGATPSRPHTESDTLTNMSKYAFSGDEADVDTPGWPDEATRLAAEAALARSFDATMDFPFYHAILMDLGVYTPPGVAGTLPELPLPDAAAMESGPDALAPTPAR